MTRRTTTAAGALMGAALLFSACGGGDESAVEIPEGATFCSVATGEYAEALAAVIPQGEDGAQESVEEIEAWARVLVELAPDEIADEAEGNLAYFEAQVAVESVADHVDDNLAFAVYVGETC